MSRSLTPLVLTQEVLKYRQHATHCTNPIVFEDNPLSWFKANGHHFPTLSRLARRSLTISVTSCPVERTLLVFMHEDLPLVRKIRADRIVEVSEISTNHWETHSFQSVTPSFRTDPLHTSTIKETLFLFLVTFTTVSCVFGKK